MKPWVYIKAGKEKAKAGAEKVKSGIKSLPFQSIAEEKIPQETRIKYPVLEKLIPKTNFIICGFFILFLFVLFFNASGGSRRASPLTQFQCIRTDDDRGIIITNYTGSSAKVIIPARINGMPVQRIGDSAFEDNNFVTSLVIPNSVNYIGMDAFNGMQNLSKLTLPASSELVIGIDAFADLPELRALVIPNSIRRVRFTNMDGLIINSPDSWDWSFLSSTRLIRRTRQTLGEWGYRTIK